MKLKITLIATILMSLFASCNSEKEKPVGLKTINLTGDQVISEPIILSSNTVLRGNGYKLTLKDGANCPVIIVGDVSDKPGRVENVTVRDLTIEGNAKNQKDEIWPGSQVRNNGISVRAGFHISIDKVTISNSRSGGIVLERGCRDVIVSNSKVTTSVFDGIAAYETENSVIFNCELSFNGAAGISLDNDMNKNYLVHNRLESNGVIGIFARDASDNQFEDIIVENHSYGVFLAESEKEFSQAMNNVFKNMVFNSNQKAFRVNNISCVGNTLVNSTFNGNKVNVSEAQPGLVFLK